MSSFPLWLLGDLSDHDRSGDVPADMANRLAPVVPSASDADSTSTGRGLLAGETDAVLLTELRAGNAVVFERIVRGTFDALAEFAYAYVVSYDVAEDVAQAVLVRLWEDRARLRPDMRLRAYVYTAVRNRALDMAKHERVVARSRERLQTAPTPENDVPADEALLSAELRERLSAAMARLTPRQRDAVHLRYMAELTMPEVAAALGVSERGAHGLLARALAELRTVMRAYREGSAPPRDI